MSKMDIKTEKDLLTDIYNGKYRDSYLIYNRKSTDDEDNQKNSIAYQRTENTRFAFKERLPIAVVTIKGFCSNGIVSEKHSGFKEDKDISITEEGIVQYRIDRPKFQKMLQFVSQGYFKGLVCLCWDRISRNRGDDTLITKLMSRGVDIRFTYATYDKTSSGALHMDIDGMFSRHHSRVTSEKVTLTIRNAREKGICTYRAPLGYLNLGKMENKPLDPKRAPIIKQLYEYYATGDWSLSDLARYAKNQGFVTMPMRPKRTIDEMLADEEDEVLKAEKVSRPVTLNQISRILSNPFYRGLIIGNDGNYVKSTSHEALISDELFFKVQSMLKKKTVSIHYSDKLNLPLRGIVRCQYCHRVYTPYVKKGIQYYNARCIKDCENILKNCNFSFIQKGVAKLMSNLHFTDGEIADMDTRFNTDLAINEAKWQNYIDNIERQKKRIKEDLAYLVSNKLSLLKTGVYSPEDLHEEEIKLTDQLIRLQNEKQVSDLEIRENMKDVIKLSELIKNLIPYYNFANPLEIDQIIRIIFSELTLSQNTLNYKCKKGFSCFENRFLAVCDPIAWLSEVSINAKLIKDNIQTLEDLLAAKKPLCPAA